MLLNLTQLKEKYNLNIDGVIHIGGHWGEEHTLYKSLNVENIIYFVLFISLFSLFYHIS